MIDYSIGELQLACEMQFKQILKHLGVRSGMGYTIPSYFYCSVNGPRKSRLQVIAMEIKSGYLKKSRYFIFGEKFDGWAEITKAEFTALRILKKVGDRKMSVIEYEPEICLITIKGDDGIIITDKNSADSIDDFLKVLDVMGEIRSGDFYTRIKEAEHE